MKKSYRIIGVVIAVLLVFGMAACGGGGGTDSDDPNLGVWVAKEAEMFGMTSPVEDFFGSGFTMELKAKGKCALNVDGSKANGTWSLDGDAFYVKGGGLECNGYLKNGKIVLEDVLGMGLNLVFEKEGGYAGTVTEEADVDGTSGGSSDLQNYWNGTWYGVMSTIEGTGKYEDGTPNEDMYMVVEIDAGGSGTYTVYDGGLDIWAEAECMANEESLIAISGELAYSPEPMDLSEWSFYVNNYATGYCVMSAVFVDFDGDTFELDLRFKPWGADWEEDIDFGRAAIYPPGYYEYWGKVMNGEPSPFGDFGPGGGAASTGGSTGFGSDDDSDSGASTSSGGGSSAGGGLASAPSFSVDELKSIYDAINADAWDLSQDTAKYEDIRDKYFKGAGADEYIGDDDSEYRYRWNSVDGSGRVDVYFNKSNDGFKMLGYAW